MNRQSELILKALRKLYGRIFRKQPWPYICEQDPDKVSQIIYNRLMDDKPCMIARFGSVELIAIINYIGVKYPDKNIWKYIKGETLQWWWNKKSVQQMQSNAGFFPLTEEKISQFGELMLEDMKEVDVLGSWLEGEKYFEDRLKEVTKVTIELLNPYFTQYPWTRALKGKKVLVVHPFAELIEYQYQENREKLFDNKEILPGFSLLTLRAVQSIGGHSDTFEDWFEALEWMKNEMNNIDYDIALIGCGAYGFPLAAHAKRSGKKAVHLGGSLQLLFGIRGKRWENPDYNAIINYSTLMNEYWVRPGDNLKPRDADQVEGGCYW